MYDPLIIPPVFSKNFQKPIFNALWNRCTEQLSTAAEVVFLGYSMPLADIHAQFIFRCGFHNQIEGVPRKHGRDKPTGPSKVMVVNPDQGHIQIQTPLVDCWDLEARFLKKFSIETGSHAESVMQIPFQLYSYRVAEKEKMSPNLSKEESSDTGGESASESVSDPPTTTPKYTKSLCLDAISEYSESDTRSIYSEAPKKKISPASKKSGDMAKLRRNSSAG